MRLIPGIQVVESKDHFYKLSSGSACTSHHNKSINVKKKDEVQKQLMGRGVRKRGCLVD